MNSPALDVLVVDDESLIRWAVVSTLTTAGHRVREAADAAAAIAALTAGGPTPDAVLLDYRLPDTRGLDLLIRIRRLAPDTVIVMMSADQTPEMRAEALARGAAAVLQKPFDMGEIETLMSRAAVSPRSPDWPR
jgi:DNA-binding NtrC family response regulator